MSLAAPIETELTPDQPEPAIHDMKGRPADGADPDGLTFAQDRLGLNVHGEVDSHIDALCHVMYRKSLYNRVPAAVTAQAAAAQQVTVQPGDLLFVRVGHRRRRKELGPWDATASRAGLHPEALEFVADHQVAVLGSDSNSDVSPTAADGVSHPVHVLAINALGLHLLDYLQFDDLVPLCETAGRWSFFCVIAPLRVPRATGSPVNPIAIV